MMARRLLVLVLTLLVGPIVVARTPAAVAVEPATRPVVVRGSDWYVRDTLTSGTADQPVAGDWDGNGTTTIGVKRGGAWLLRNHNSAGRVDLSINYGLGCDLADAGAVTALYGSAGGLTSGGSQAF